MRNIKDIFQDFRDGEKISTEELTYLKERMSILLVVSREFGPCMDIVVNFISPRLESVNSYLKHREERAAKKDALL